MEKRFCPKCKSEDIRKEINILLAVGAPQKWERNKCGYEGTFFLLKLKNKK